MVSNASWTVRIFSDWMSSCRVKNGCRVADSFEFCWYTTDLIKENSWWGTRRRDIRGHGWPAALREDDDHNYCSVKFNLRMLVWTRGKEVCNSGCPWWLTASATLIGEKLFSRWKRDSQTNYSEQRLRADQRDRTRLTGCTHHTNQSTIFKKPHHKHHVTACRTYLVGLFPCMTSIFLKVEGFSLSVFAVEASRLFWSPTVGAGH